MTPSPEIEPGPHWWEASALPLRQPCSPYRISLFYAYFFSFLDCVERLGMENGDIKDSQITASSSRTGDLPEYGRLNNKKQWCPAKASKDEYFQVDLGEVRK